MNKDLVSQIAQSLAPMHDRQQIVAVAGAISIALIVFELVRRRKLREEYSWVWIVTAISIVVLALNQSLLLTLTSWIGAASPASTLFFGAIVFLLSLSVQFSIRLSRLTHRQRTVAQRLALLEAELADFRKQTGKSNIGSTSQKRIARREASSDEVA
ncbi:DUF2304 domain-containing protein [bacterium]|nr:DUF2304 domain-containing protein [bacterium]